MKAKKKIQEPEQVFMNGVILNTFLASDEPTLPLLQQAIEASGLSDAEISDRCNRGVATIKRLRDVDGYENKDFGPFLSTFDEVKGAIKLALASGIEPIKKGLKLVGRKK